MILTHYYHKSDRPFQSLSSLWETEALSIIGNLQARTGDVYRRFGNPDREWQTERARKYDLFIEAQVWDAIE